MLQLACFSLWCPHMSLYATKRPFCAKKLCLRFRLLKFSLFKTCWSQTGHAHRSFLLLPTRLLRATSVSRDCGRSRNPLRMSQIKPVQTVVCLCIHFVFARIPQCFAEVKQNNWTSRYVHQRDFQKIYLATSNFSPEHEVQSRHELISQRTAWCPWRHQWSVVSCAFGGQSSDRRYWWKHWLKYSLMFTNAWLHLQPTFTDWLQLFKSIAKVYKAVMTRDKSLTQSLTVRLLFFLWIFHLLWKCLLTCPLRSFTTKLKRLWKIWQIASLAGWFRHCLITAIQF